MSLEADLTTMANTLLMSCVLSVLAGCVLSVPVSSSHRKFDGDFMHPVTTQISSRAIPLYSTDEKNAEYWRTGAQNILINHLKEVPNTNQAKNVIMFLGDGMSIPTVAAARVYQGQLEGKSGEESQISFEKFPYTGLSKTYCVDSQVADSACTSTAYLGGVKGNLGTIGVTASVLRKNCEAMRNETNQVSSFLKWSQDAGKATGIVTTARVTHASPAGAYAHIADRDWESDANIESDGEDSSVCDDIAEQLVYSTTGKNFRVILGGGRQNFIPNDQVDEEGTSGERLDGQDLLAVWKQQKEDAGTKWQYVWNREELLAVNASETEYLMGLFDGSHMKFHLEADADTEPTLAEMTEVAIKLLSKEENGFAIFIEGAKIDHGHHNAQTRRALDEAVEMAKAVEKALELTSTDDTLIVVTSDHAHTMSYSGYPTRGTDILGLGASYDVDNLPYTTLSYANGPGYKAPQTDGTRYDLSQDDLTSDSYLYPGMVPTTAETHGGDDVGVFAIGPWAHKFEGVYEQNYIPNLMAYASCVGDGLTLCNSNNEQGNGNGNGHGNGNGNGHGNAHA